MPICSSCCYEGLTAVPDLNEFCVCSSPVGSTFVGSTGRIFVRTTSSIPCTLNDWVEMISPASNSFEITDGSNTDTVVLGDSLLFTSPNNSVAISVGNNVVNFALSPSIIPVNPIPGCIASNSLQGALVEICNHITGLTVTAASVTVQDTLGCFAGTNVEDVLAEICGTLLNMPASNVKIVDSGGYYISNHVEGALAEIGNKLVALPATNIAVADVGNCYAATNLEAVLAEICTKFTNISANNISVPDPGGYFVSAQLTTVLQEIGAELSALPAVQVTIVDAGGCFTATNVETALQELCSALNSLLAVDIAVTDAGGYFTGTNVETVLQEIGAELGALPAVQVTVADIGGYYTGTNVETVLQEIGLTLASVPGPMSVSDTNSVDLTFALNTLSADVKISPNVGNTLSILPNGLFASGGGGSCGRSPWVIIGQPNNTTCQDILETDNIWHTGNVAIGANAVPSNTKFYVNGRSIINNTTATISGQSTDGAVIVGGTGGTVLAETGVLVGGSNNTVTGAVGSSSPGSIIVAGGNNTINNSGDSSIISSSGSTITGSHSGRIFGAFNGSISGTIGGRYRNTLIGGEENDIDDGNNTMIINGLSNRIENSFNATIIGGYTNQIVDTGSAGQGHNVIIGGFGNYFNNAGTYSSIISSTGMGVGGTSGSTVVVMASSGGAITSSSNLAVIATSLASISASNGLYTGNNVSVDSQTYSFTGGRNIVLSHAGTSFMYNTSATTLSSVAANQFRVNFIGGYFLATNNAATTGMQLAAGGSSWTAISARETKKDFTEVDYDNILTIIDNVTVYKGRYKDQPDDETHLYLIAEEWNSSIKDLVSPKSVLVQDGEDGTKNMPAVNHMDIMSVSLAANKALKLENDALKETVKDLINRVNALEALNK